MKSCWIVLKDHKAVLEWRDVPVPQPKSNEIIVKVRASALNRGELVVGGAVHGGHVCVCGRAGGLTYKHCCSLWGWLTQQPDDDLARACV